MSPAEQLPQVVMPACPVIKLLQGQKALVTGANSGIGQGIAINTLFLHILNCILKLFNCLEFFCDSSSDVIS